MNQFIGYWKYNIKLIAIKGNFKILLIPNYYMLQITIIYIIFHLVKLRLRNIKQV